MLQPVRNRVRDDEGVRQPSGVPMLEFRDESIPR